MNENYKNCLGYRWIENNDRIWLIPWNSNVICSIDLTTYRVTDEVWLSEFEDFSTGLYYSILSAENKLILIPGRAKEIVVYDVISKDINFIDYEVPKKNRNEKYDKNANFYRGITKGKYAYILGASYPAIIKLDVETLNITYISGWIDELNGCIPQNDTNYFFPDGAIVEEECAYIPVGCCAAIVKLNLNTDETSVIKISSSIEGFYGIVKYKNDFWLLGRHGDNCKLICWNPIDGCKNDVYIEKKYMDFSSPIYWSPILVEDELFICPISAGNIYKVNMDTLQVDICTDVLENIGSFPDQIHGCWLWICFVKNTKIYFQTGWNSMCYEYDIYSHRINEFGVKIKSVELQKRYRQKLGNLIYEAQMSVSDFLLSLDGL